MDGIWVRSQDSNTLVFVKTFEIWNGGRIVARFGKDFKWLGDYNGQDEARAVLDNVEQFLTSTRNQIYQMPGGN